MALDRPAYGFAEAILYEYGALPATDDLMERCQLLSIDPAMSDEQVAAVIAAFQAATA